LVFEAVALIAAYTISYCRPRSKCTADDSVLAVQQLASCELDVVIGGGCDSAIPSLQGLAAFNGIQAIDLEARSAL
jgi:hypothetical protein